MRRYCPLSDAQIDLQLFTGCVKDLCTCFSALMLMYESTNKIITQGTSERHSNYTCQSRTETRIVFINLFTANKVRCRSSELKTQNLEPTQIIKHQQEIKNLKVELNLKSYCQPNHITFMVTY